MRSSPADAQITVDKNDKPSKRSLGVEDRNFRGGKSKTTGVAVCTDSDQLAS